MSRPGFWIKRGERLFEASSWDMICQWAQAGRLKLTDEYSTPQTQGWREVRRDPTLSGLVPKRERLILKRGSQEYSAPNYEVIQDWARRGQVSPDDMLYSGYTQLWAKISDLPSINQLIPDYVIERNAQRNERRGSIKSSFEDDESLDSIARSTSKALADALSSLEESEAHLQAAFSKTDLDPVDPLTEDQVTSRDQSNLEAHSVDGVHQKIPRSHKVHVPLELHEPFEMLEDPEQKVDDGAQKADDGEQKVDDGAQKADDGEQKEDDRAQDGAQKADDRAQDGAQKVDNGAPKADDGVQKADDGAPKEEEPKKHKQMSEATQTQGEMQTVAIDADQNPDAETNQGLDLHTHRDAKHGDSQDAKLNSSHDLELIDSVDQDQQSEHVAEHDMQDDLEDAHQAVSDSVADMSEATTETLLPKINLNTPDATLVCAPYYDTARLFIAIKDLRPLDHIQGESRLESLDLNCQGMSKREALEALLIKLVEHRDLYYPDANHTGSSVTHELYEAQEQLIELVGEIIPYIGEIGHERFVVGNDNRPKMTPQEAEAMIRMHSCVEQLIRCAKSYKVDQSG